MVYIQLLLDISHRIHYGSKGTTVCIQVTTMTTDLVELADAMFVSYQEAECLIDQFHQKKCSKKRCKFVPYQKKDYVIVKDLLFFGRPSRTTLSTMPLCRKLDFEYLFRGLDLPESAEAFCYIHKRMSKEEIRIKTLQKWELSIEPSMTAADNRILVEYVQELLGLMDRVISVYDSFCVTKKTNQDRMVSGKDRLRKLLRKYQ